MKFFKKIGKFILRLFIGVTLVFGSITMYSYYNIKAEENRIEYLENLADRYNSEFYVSIYINKLLDIYKKTGDDSLAIYKTKKDIDLHNKEKNGYYNDKLKSGQYFILQDLGNTCKLYEEQKIKFTQKKNIKNDDIEKIADIDNHAEILSSHNAMIKEIKSLRGTNNLPYKLESVIGMLNIMEGHEYDWNGKYPTVEKSTMQEISDFIEDSWKFIKWILIILFISAIANAVTGEKMPGLNFNAKDEEPDRDNDNKQKMYNSPRETSTTDVKFKIDTKNKKLDLEKKRVGLMTLIIPKLFEGPKREWFVIKENNQYFIDLKEDINAKNLDELILKARKHFLLLDSVKAVEFKIY